MPTVAEQQIELNKKYGKQLVYIAWGIEIVAASIGLFIGISSALSTIEYYNNLEEGTIVGNTFTNVFIGAAPFIIIAAVELTKIPLALGFYRAKKILWRSLFIVTLGLLVFVTFETMFNGLERNFSATEQTIKSPKAKYDEREALLINIEKRLEEINSRNLDIIDEEYVIKFNDIEQERNSQISALYDARTEEQSKINEQITSLSQSFGVIADATGLERSVDRIRQDLALAEENYQKNVDTENSSAQVQLENLDIQIQRLNDNMSAELLEAGFFDSKDAIRNNYQQLRAPLEKERADVVDNLNAKLLRLQNEHESYVTQKNNELAETEDSLISSQGAVSGRLDKNIDSLNIRLNEITERYNNRIAEVNKIFDNRVLLTETQKAEAKELQSNREIAIPDLEEERDALRTELIRLDNIIEQAAQGSNVYRIAKDLADKERAVDVTVDEIAFVKYLWFGSVALIAALVGPILALAGFVLQDPDAYVPPKRSNTNILQNLRGLIVDLRRRIRRPVIKYEKVQVPYEVEKIKEVPGPEKVVYKEVPKEIVKNEIVYVPLYSVEDGTVLKEKDPKK